LVIVKDDADQAKDAFKTMKSKPGSLPVAGLGDEAAHVIVAGQGGGPKVEMLAARKGSTIWGIADEEYALRGGAEKEHARLTKDDALARLKPLLAAAPPAPDARADSGAPAAAPSGAASSAPKPKK
jgi:hypothetical protein